MDSISNILNSNWDIYSIPLLLLFLVVTGNFIGQLLPCKLQDVITNNMYLKHLIAFLILLFVIEIGERKYKTFTELFLNSLIIYFVFLLATRVSIKFFVAFVLIISLIYILLIYKEKQSDESIKLNIIQLSNILYYLALFVLIMGVLYNFNKKRKKHGKDFNILRFFFGSECKLKRKHEY
jgi:hypothetical protein